MTEGILTVLGGVGLFLLGMKIMTEALREAAGGGLRHFLATFTTTPLRGTLTGAAATALVQSSTATSVMTVGFVGAGLLTFPQALGVLYGANIGTTITGWMVTMLGFKLQLGTVALPILFAASLAVVLGSGQIGRAGRGLAGLCLLFIGLDMMQAGATLADGLVTPETLPGDGSLGRMQLALLGLVLVVVVQSSSAGMAMVLVMLGTGAIGFAQAAAFAIGMNLGTTITALLASIGGGYASRQTATANLLFNAGTAVLAFPLLDLVSPLLHGTALGRDDQTALVLFHTGFNVLGAMVFLPLTSRFAALVERLVPAPRAQAKQGIDPALLADPASALDAAHSMAEALAREMSATLGAALAPTPDLRGLSAVSLRSDAVLNTLEDFLAMIEIPADQRETQTRKLALLHQVDHLRRLLDRIEDHAALDVIGSDPVLARTAAALGASLRRPDRSRKRRERLARLIEARARRFRTRTLWRQAQARASVPEVLRRTDAMRWLMRVSHHVERLAHYQVISAPLSEDGAGGRLPKALRKAMRRQERAG